jgi:Uma2 family endonuclease
MNIQSRYPTTPDEFLRWNEGREGKREFVNGRVVEMMINVTENHYRLASRLMVQLANQLDDAEFIVGSADFGVKTEEGVRYPGVMVHKPGNGRRLATREPLLIGEVLSASSMADDFGPKARDYQALPSLQHYMTLSQDEVRVWVWSRGEDRAWKEPEIFEEGLVSLTIDGKAVLVDLPALYAGIASVKPKS